MQFLSKSTALAVAWHMHFRWAGWELLEYNTGGGVLNVQAVGFALGFGGNVESSGEMPRVVSL